MLKKAHNDIPASVVDHREQRLTIAEIICWWVLLLWSTTNVNKTPQCCKTSQQLTSCTKGVTHTMSKKSAKQAEKHLQDIRKVARLDGNKQCVDCPEKVWTANIRFNFHFPL